MTELKCDVEKINEVGQTVVTKAEELAKIFDELYRKLYSIQKNDVWLGHSSNHFLDNSIKDKSEVDVFCKQLREYGNVLVFYADKLKTITTKYKRD